MRNATHNGTMRNDTPTPPNEAFLAISPTQREVIFRMRRAGKRLVRRPGGKWVLEGTAKPTPPGWSKRPDRRNLRTAPWGPFDGADEFGRARSWSVDVRTVRALEKRGLLERTYEDPREWCDPRRLPGRAA
jgi:hypothetical protein